MNRTVAALAAVAALAVGLLTSSAAGAAEGARHPTSAVRQAPAKSGLSRLHATHGQGAAIRNARGAQVLLRGVNVNGLVEYYQPNALYAPNLPQTREDFRSIARLGFNSVRLLLSWSRLQPTRGAYDTAYVAQVRQQVRWAGEAGLYVVLDMHQDAWGPTVGTPLGTTCPDTTHPNNGWDGAPGWATITDRRSTCTPGERELSPAVMRAWDHFYADTDGIQTQLVQTWGRLARDFAGSATIAGYDLLNEPGFGGDLEASSSSRLGRFYQRAIAAIRAGERQGHGFSHVVFFEPSVMWSAMGSWSVPAKSFTRDRNIAFAPHIYAESLSSNTIAEGFRLARVVATDYGVPVWSGEWGFFPSSPSEAAGKVASYAAAEDAYRFGGAWWVWKQACGNPHMIGAPGGTPGPVSQSLVRYTCPDGTAQPVSPVFGDVLSRTTARAVPGRITMLTSDGRTGRFELRGVRGATGDRCALRVFVPQRFAHAPLHVQGVRGLKRRPALGGVVLRGCVADRFRVRVG